MFIAITNNEDYHNWVVIVIKQKHFIKQKIDLNY